MKGHHSLGWKELRAAEDLAAKALEVFPDRAEPEADREWLRVKWCAAIRHLREGPGFLLDRHVPRVTSAEAA